MDQECLGAWAGTAEKALACNGLVENVCQLRQTVCVHDCNLTMVECCLLDSDSPPISHTHVDCIADETLRALPNHRKDTVVWIHLENRASQRVGHFWKPRAK